jgi:hypothetical protein
MQCVDIKKNALYAAIKYYKLPDQTIINAIGEFFDVMHSISVYLFLSD